ncbi:hypothetical protein J6590_081437 [Homalodisca vitripennis]|nr:hypothetical protein J6590_081437 [Homalodisca vitripennis]
MFPCSHQIFPPIHGRRHPDRHDTHPPGSGDRRAKGRGLAALPLVQKRWWGWGGGRGRGLAAIAALSLVQNNSIRAHVSAQGARGLLIYSLQRRSAVFPDSQTLPPGRNLIQLTFMKEVSRYVDGPFVNLPRTRILEEPSLAEINMWETLE